MITYLEIENFYSFSERQSVDLMGGVRLPARRVSKESVPKVIAIFGPNASGKSNLLKAITFVRFMMENSFSSSPGKSLPYLRFLGDGRNKSETRIYVEFIGNDIERSKKSNSSNFQCKYAYELLVCKDKPLIRSEVLYFWPLRSGRRNELFRRSGPKIDKISNLIIPSEGKGIAERILRDDATLLSTLSRMASYLVDVINDGIGSLHTNILFQKRSSDFNVFEDYSEELDTINRLNDDITGLDLGLERVALESDDGELEFRFYHKGISVPLPPLLESHGTREFVNLYPKLNFALRTGGLAVIDEFDSSLHPMILLEVVRWFRDKRRNPLGAQLWITCHSVSLLEELGQDEVYFCEKGESGETEVFGLADFEKSEEFENYYMNYMGGIYGAVPNIG